MGYSYAQIDENRVVVSVTQAADEIEHPSMIAITAYDAALLGRRHDAASRQFIAVPPVPAPRHITKRAFRSRFTKPERAAIEWAAVDRPELSTEQRMQAAALRSDLKDQEQATYIDLDDADVATGVQTLEAIGLLDAGRALEIIGAVVQSEERP